MHFFFSQKETVVDKVKKVCVSLNQPTSDALPEKDLLRVQKTVTEVYNTFITDKSKQTPKQLFSLVEAIVQSEYISTILSHLALIGFEQKKHLYSVIAYLYKHSETYNAIKDSFSKPSFGTIKRIIKENYTSEEEISHLIGEVIRKYLSTPSRIASFVDLEFVKQLGQMTVSNHAGKSAEALKTLDSILFVGDKSPNSKLIDQTLYSEAFTRLFIDVLNTDTYMKRYFIEKYFILISNYDNSQSTGFVNDFLNNPEALKITMTHLLSGSKVTKTFAVLLFFKFVTYENKTSGIKKILIKNKENIKGYLEKIKEDYDDHNDKDNIIGLSSKVLGVLERIE